MMEKARWEDLNMILIDKEYDCGQHYILIWSKEQVLSYS